MNTNYPSYLKLYRSGELADRLFQLEQRLKACTICPHRCGNNRYEQAKGICRSGDQPYVSSICDHHGEEPVLSGRYGSGTVFFGSCNLSCAYCQNYQISQDVAYFSSCLMDCKTLARRIVDLQNRFQVHNINFVSPTHFVPQMVRAIYEAIPLGLNVPIVYNSNGYDAVETLRLLDGIIDIYLPDFKYADDSAALKYSRAKNYSHHALAAIKEMHRQVGDLEVDSSGIARRGVLVRHLVLPNDLAHSEQILKWLAEEVSPDLAISLMAQYHPSHLARFEPLLMRPVTYREYQRVLEVMDKLNLKRGFSQQLDAPEYYLPDFYRQDHPFES